MNDVDDPGESPDDGLSGPLAAAARRLRAAPPAPLPPGFAAAVVRRARPPAAAARSPGRRLAAWWRGRSLRPAVQWLRLAVACAVTFAVARWDAAPEDRIVLVRFAVAAPAARSVTLAGDFNDWDPQAIRLEDPRGDGHWQAIVPIEPGVYQYMFVVDGKRWIADPQAPETLDDGFGQRNSLVRIGDPSTAAGDGAARGFL